MNTNDKNESTGQLPTSSQKLNLSERKSSNSLLDRMSKDAFNILSKISKNEVQLGAWTIDKTSHAKLIDLFDEWAFIADFEEYKDYNFLAYLHLELGFKKGNDKDNILFFNPIEFVNSRQMLAPSKSRRWDKVGIDKYEFLQKLKDFHIHVRSHLDLEEIDNQIRFLNCSFKERDRAIDFTNFRKIERLKCNNCEIYELALPSHNTITHLDCSVNNIKELDFGMSNALVSLDCSDNYISQLNLSQHRELITLIASNNALQNLDLSKDSFKLYQKDDFFDASIFLEIQNNRLLKIDVSGYDICKMKCDETVVVIANLLELNDNDEIIGRDRVKIDMDEYLEAGGNEIVENLEIEYL